MDSLLQLCFFILILLELFELFWQKGSTFRKYLVSLFYFYQKSVLLFICMHPSFYFMLFCIILFQSTSPLALFIVGVKMIDIAFKLTLLDRLINHKPLGFFAPLASEDYPLPFGLKLFPVVLYPALFFYAFS